MPEVFSRELGQTTIKKVIDENADIIIKRWKEHFEK